MDCNNIHFPKKQLLKNKGFTLIEAVVALAVLSVGILTINIMQTGAARGNFRASQITAASAWAGDRMEKINGMTFDDDSLLDRNGTGTGQDANSNGIDDDNEAGSVDNITDFGLNETTNADYTYPSNENGLTMHYNVAINHPTENMKTIRLIIVRNADRQQLIFDYYKAGPL